MLPGVIVSCLALALLLWAEYGSHRSVVWITKPLASMGFVLASWGAGALHTSYGRWLLAAQTLGAVGDVLLIPKGHKTFLAGLLCFLLGHVALTWAFVSLAQSMMVGAMALGVLSLAASQVQTWLVPHVPQKLRAPVVAYIAVITLMAACAINAITEPHGIPVALGATLFYVSDLCVARQEFITKSFINKAWGLPLYYGAQLILASSLT